MVGIRALFSARQVSEVFEAFQEHIDNKTLAAFQYVGEEFVNKARIGGNYKDRTGNLRSSIGYIILKDGRVLERNFQGNRQGKKQGQKVAAEVALQYPKGYVLIGVAGMQYAAYVEAKNYDVITGATPGSDRIKSILREIKL